MSIEEQGVINFLTELYNMTAGDVSQQVSMYEVGIAVGLDKSSAGALAEELIVDGYAELVTLSGGISITAEGLKELNIAPAGASETIGCTLRDEINLGEEGRKAVEEMLVMIKEAVAVTGSVYEQLEQIVIDIKTAEVQLLSPKPKTEIIREVLRSIRESMSTAGNSAVAEQIGRMISS